MIVRTWFELESSDENSWNDSLTIDNFPDVSFRFDLVNFPAEIEKYAFPGHFLGRDVLRLISDKLWWSSINYKNFFWFSYPILYFISFHHKCIQNCKIFLTLKWCSIKGLFVCLQFWKSKMAKWKNEIFDVPHFLALKCYFCLHWSPLITSYYK